MEKQNTVFIHVGTHKTGSTAIQRSLQKNARLLRKYGYHFVQDSPSYHVALKKISSDEIHGLEKEKCNYQKIIANAGSNSLILSSEGFSGNILDSYPDTGDIARNLNYIFNDYNVKIIAYLRRQDLFIESAYTQSIHEGAIWTFKDFCDKIGIYGFDWYEFITHYARYFGKENMIVRPYEKNQLKDGTVVSDFLSLLGIPFENIKQEATEWSNRSYNRSSLEIARICNSNLSIDDRKQLRLLLQATNAKQPFEYFSFLLPRSRLELLDYYEQSNLKVAEEFMARKDARLFLEVIPENDDSINEQQNGLSTDELAVLVMNIFLAQDTIQSNITRASNPYTLAFIGELESCLLKIVDKVGMRDFLSRLYKQGINLMRRI